MARVNMEEVDEQKVTQELPEDMDLLVKTYVENKLEADAYSDLCSQQGAVIKERMKESGLSTIQCGNYKLTRVEMEKSEFIEGKLLDVLHKYNVPGVTKTVEVVDYDALESFLYKNMYSEDFPADLAEKIAECKKITNVVQLRMTKSRKKEA